MLLGSLSHILFTRRNFDIYTIFFLLLLTLFIIDTTFFSLYTYAGHGHDEPTHYYHINSIYHHWKPEGYAVSQPLYYIISSSFLFFTQPHNFNDALVIHILRFASISFSVVTVIFVYKTSNIVFHKDKWLALFSTAFIAFLPTFDWINSIVNNDSLAWALSTISIYFLLKYVNEFQKIKFLLISAIFASLAISTKENTILIYPVVLVALFSLLFSKKISKTQLIKRFALFIAITIVVASWHMAYLAANGYSPFGFGLLNQLEGLLVNHTISSGTAQVNANSISFFYVTSSEHIFVRLFQFAFGGIDGNFIWAPSDLVSYAFAFLVLSVGGLVFLTVWRKKLLQLLDLKGSHLVILFSYVIFLVGSIFFNWLFTEVGLVRYTFPAIAGYGVLFTVGLSVFIQHRKMKFLLLVPLILLFIINISLFFLLVHADFPPEFNLPYPPMYFATSYFVPWTGPEKAFDGDIGTVWHSLRVDMAVNPQKIQAAYWQPQIFDHVKIIAGVNWHPRNFDIEASNDGINYTILKSVTDETGWTTHSIHEYSFTNHYAYHYYRISVSVTQGSNPYVEFSEIQFSYIPLPPQYTTTSQYVPWTGPEKAFDGDVSTVWHSKDVNLAGLPQKIQVVYWQPQIFDHIKIIAGVDWHPRNFDIEASNDGINYTILKSVTDETGWTNHSIHEYSFTNDNSYRYYTVSINQVQGPPPYVDLSEIVFSQIK